MKKTRTILTIYLLPFILIFASFSLAKDDKDGDKLNKKMYKQAAVENGKVGDAYRLFINNINLPMNSKGVIAAVDVLDNRAGVGGAGGKFAGDVFLFSSGFFLSGYANGTLFANAVASASLVEDYVPGTVENGAADPRAQLYVVKSSDEPFVSKSWQDWADAVALGADFYDGDNDGSYNPVDRNGNGVWDPDEDRPDLIGDETVWTVYNDGLPQGTRRWNTVAPLGIEIRQTVFAFASSGAIGNIIFVRYRFKYVGLNNPNEPNELDDVYFGVWADTDIGDATDDLVGVDVARNAGYTYNDGPDPNPAYADRPPAFFIDFFSGPVSYVAGETYTDNNGNGVYDDGVDTPLDTAYSVRGQVKGVEVFPGAKNLGVSSFIQYKNGDPIIDDPDNATVARYYNTGLDYSGNEIDPCTFSYGQVFGIPCETVDNRFWYSGDPVTQTGWINTVEGDARQITNVGPFQLEKGEEKEIVVAYVVAQGENSLDAITEARKIDDGAQDIFDNNFLAPSPPPAPAVTVETGAEFIDLKWETPNQVTYRNTTNTYDLHFKGYNVYAYRTSQNVSVVANQPNRKLLATYQVDDFINDLYFENGQTGGIELLYEASPNQLSPSVYTDPETGRIRLRITEDPFTGGDLVKGKPYYFAVTSYAINYEALVSRQFPDTSVLVEGDYYLSSNTFVQSVENVQNVIIVTLGENLYDPPRAIESANHIAGGTSGNLNFDVIEKENLTGNEYQVTFIVDSSTAQYSTFWRLENTTTGEILIDSSKRFTVDQGEVAVRSTQGFIVKLDTVSPELGTLQKDTQTQWYSDDNTQVFYVSPDITSSRNIASLSGLSTLNGNFLKADKLRRVEIRFGETQKAYRYLNGYIGSLIGRRNSYVYAEGVTAADTAGKGAVGKLGEGFVDVPFTVWVEDFETPTGGFGEMRQLAVGFIEKSTSLGGNPDGVWDPDTSIASSGEYILIFNSSYDPNGSQTVYKGGFPDGTNTVWADLRGGNSYSFPADAPLTDEEKKIAKSPFFNSLYVVGVQYADANSTFSSGDQFVIPVLKYPYTPEDIFAFKTASAGELTLEEKKALFEKVNVFPNPMYGYNIATSYTGGASDEPFVTFSNLPEEVTIKIYSLAGTHLRTLGTADKSSPTSPFLNWNLQNESGLRVASGLYLAIVSSPQFGEKVLKFSIIMPQKQIQRY